MSAALSKNKITLYTGASLHFETDDGKPVDLVASKKKNHFLALFERDDVDFEIVVTNDWVLPGEARGLSVDIITLSKENMFCLYPEETMRFETIENEGRKFHFISQNSDSGRQLVGTAAKLLGSNLADASEQISQIEFCFEIEKLPGLPEVKGESVKFFVLTLTQKKIPITIGLHNTIMDLKLFIESIESIPVDQQRLIFQGNALDDDEKISDYEIGDGCVVHLVLRLRGGFGGGIHFFHRLTRHLVIH